MIYCSIVSFLCWLISHTCTVTHAHAHAHVHILVFSRVCKNSILSVHFEAYMKIAYDSILSFDLMTIVQMSV